MPLQMVRQSHPVSLKSLAVDTAGRLSQRRSVGPLFFGFTHGGRPYSCRFTERGGRAVVSVETPLGRLDATSVERRRQVRRIVRAARHDGIGLIIRRDGRVDFADRARPAPPVQAHDLVGSLTTTVIRAAPWLALLDEYLKD